MKTKNSRAQKTADDEFEPDPTMAVSASHITMIENRLQSAPVAPLEFNIENDDFGALLRQEFEQSLHSPEAAMNIAPALIDDIVDQQVSQFKEIVFDEDVNMGFSKEFEKTLADDVLDIVSKQRSHRKRRGTDEIDIGLRLDSSKKQRLEAIEAEDKLDDNNNGLGSSKEQQLEAIAAEDKIQDVNNNIETSPFDLNANVPEVEPASDKSLQLLNSTFVAPPEETNLIAVSSQLASSELSPIHVSKKKKQKLIVDKQIKISDAVLKKDAENYQTKSTVPSPLDTFQRHIQALKDSIGVLILGPASRMNKYSNKLIPAFQRNLKKITAKTHKRQFEEDEQLEPPAKRQSLRNLTQMNYVEDLVAENVPVAPIPISGIEPVIHSDQSSIADGINIATEAFVEPPQVEDYEPVHMPAQKTNKGHEKYLETSKSDGNYNEW